MKRFIILGAGISGLSLGWYLKRRFGEKIHLTIIDRAPRTGGWVQTVMRDGFLFEQGPRSIRPEGTGLETLRLIEELGLQEEVIVADTAAKYRYLWYQDKLRCLPTGPLSFLTSPLMHGVVPACFHDIRTPLSSKSDETIYDFFSRRMSPQVATRLIDPMVSGIYAGDIKQLSIKSCFPKIYDWEQTSKSIIRGALKRKKNTPETLSPFVQEIQKSPLYSFKKGMETLTKGLSSRLREHLYLSQQVASLSFEPGKVNVTLSSGEVLTADHVYSTLPAHVTAPLFCDHHQELSQLLASIPQSSVACVNVGYHRSVLKKKGFGYLIPSSEREQILGTVFDSSAFPQQNHIPEQTRLTVMIGGAHMINFDNYAAQDFVSIALQALAKHLKITSPPDAVTVKMARLAIPQYHLGHAARVAHIESIIARVFPRITLHGNSFHGIALNDCIAGSKQLEERVHLFR